MDPFPFTESEWEAVKQAAVLIVNASMAEDEVLMASHTAHLNSILADLREQYGDHPILLETEADFTQDEAEQIALYRQALEIAEANHLPTESIRASLADIQPKSKS